MNNTRVQINVLWLLLVTTRGHLDMVGLGGGNTCGTEETRSESEIFIKNLAHIDSKRNFPQFSGNASWSHGVV